MERASPGQPSNNDQLPHALFDRILSYVESDLGAMMTTGMNLSMRAILRAGGAESTHVGKNANGRSARPSN